MHAMHFKKINKQYCKQDLGGSTKVQENRAWRAAEGKKVKMQEAGTVKMRNKK